MKNILRYSIVLISLCCCSLSSFTQSVDAKLERMLREIVSGFHGDVGVFVKDIRRNKIATINADTLFPTASMVKIPILIGVMNKLERGELQYEQELIYNDSILYPGVDILGSFKPGEKIELGKIMMLMLTMSDNTASLWLQLLAGTGIEINRILDSLGFHQTRVNSKTPGRELDRERFGWGQTTPREIATMMEAIAQKKMLSSAASERMLRVLGRSFWDDVSLSQIPAGVFVASKNGAVDRSRSEVLYVNAPGRPYIFAVCTKNNVDTSWTSSNEAWTMIRKLSAILWNYFQPSNRR
jgi:beta-lactamase class A